MAANHAAIHEGACPFCHIDAKRIIHQNTHGFAVRDGFPVSPGHSLIIPKRHVGSFFDLSREEHIALLDLLDLCHAGLDPASSALPCHPELDSGSSALSSQKISSFNIGINDGPAAGQTVPHCHIHLIPRYTGDVKDPRGGVRWVLTEKADYWSKKS